MAISVVEQILKIDMEAVARRTAVAFTGCEKCLQGEKGGGAKAKHARTPAKKAKTGGRHKKAG